jgi:hypothetical protein
MMGKREQAGSLEEVGRVERFYARPSVAVIRLRLPLRVGERVYIKGQTTDLEQAVVSLELDHAPAQEVGPGQLAGLRVTDRCRKRDLVDTFVRSPEQLEGRVDPLRIAEGDGSVGDLKQR